MRAVGWMRAMGRRMAAAWFVVGCMVAAGAAAQARVHEVVLGMRMVPGRAIPEFYFDPMGLFIQPGDTVVFHAVSPHHTVTAYHPAQGKVQRVPDGVEPFSSPVIPVGIAWSYTFRIPGVYDLWCAPHEMYGMVMRIVVGEVSGPGAQPSSNFGPDGTFQVAGRILNHPLLAPQRIVAQGMVPWAAIPEEAKSLSGGPQAGR